jgi:hypothetical protein
MSGCADRPALRKRWRTMNLGEGHRRGSARAQGLHAFDPRRRRLPATMADARAQALLERSRRVDQHTMHDGRGR